MSEPVSLILAAQVKSRSCSPMEQSTAAIPPPRCMDQFILGLYTRQEPSNITTNDSVARDVKLPGKRFSAPDDIASWLMIKTLHELQDKQRQNRGGRDRLADAVATRPDV